jgi:hypothetical protein
MHRVLKTLVQQPAVHNNGIVEPQLPGIMRKFAIQVGIQKKSSVGDSGSRRGTCGHELHICDSDLRRSKLTRATSRGDFTRALNEKLAEQKASKPTKAFETRKWG